MNKCACVAGTCDRILTYTHATTIMEKVTIRGVFVFVPITALGCFTTASLVDLDAAAPAPAWFFGAMIPAFVLGGIAAAKATKALRREVDALVKHSFSLSKSCRLHQ